MHALRSILLAAAVLAAAGSSFAADDLSPISLSDADGQELILEDLSIKTAIHGMLSLTELDFRFRNPQAKRIEGRFSCTLPPNSAISRFAKDVNGELMEGEVVERLRANQVYEQFLHQMRDPALLEQEQGNRFSARIFPIEANAPVRIVLSYSRLLPLRNGERTYELPLRGMAKVKHFKFQAFVSPLPEESTSSKLTRSTVEVLTREENDWTPNEDIELTWRPTADASRVRVMRAGDFYLAAIRPEVPPSNAVTPSAWTFYIDTSASGAEGAEHRIRALEALFASMPSRDAVRVLAFDQEIVPLANGTAGELAKTIGGLLRARLFLGGTDLIGAIHHAARAVLEDPSHGIVFASDLVTTLGATESKDVVDAIKNIPPRATLHALVLGSRQDAPTAKALTAGRGRVITIPFSDAMRERARDAAESLRRPLGASFDYADAGAEWLYPTHVDDVQNGDEVILLGKLKAGAEPKFGAASTLSAGTFGPLLEREAYRAYLDYLAEREANEPSEAVRRALGTEQTRISIEQRVVIPRTTMLVLENEFEYQRFGLDRRALAAILTVGAGGIERIDRRRNDVVVQTRPVPPPRPMPRPERQKESRDQGVPPPPPPPTVAPAPVPPPAEIGAVAEAITVTASAPAIETAEVSTNMATGSTSGGFVNGGAVGSSAAPRRMAARVESRADAKQSDPNWTKLREAARAEVDKLEAKLRENPRDRETWNEIGELLVKLRDWPALRALALRWQPYDPENPQVYELLGMADEQLGNTAEAARAVASLIEVSPGKTELLQRAGLLLVRTGKAKLAEAPLRRALELRPDRVNSYRHLALMLWLDGRIEEAARVLESAAGKKFPDWYRDVNRVVREELGYVYRAWMAKEPARRAEIAARAREHDVDLDRKDAMRVTLAWETDANDVDLHVVDPSGEEVFYGHRESKSGLLLYDDITQGLGPEVVAAKNVEKGTYHVGVRYFAAGPMGISRGLVVVMLGDEVTIHPFRLAQSGGPIRHVTSINVK